MPSYPDPTITVRAEVVDEYAIEFRITGDLGRRTPAIDDALRDLRDACSTAVAEHTGRPEDVVSSAVSDTLTVTRETATL
jgi:phosphoserine phosphatase